MTARPTLAVVGTGRLAAAVCYALAVLPGPGLRVLVLGRRPDRVAELSHVATTRAAAAGRPDVAFRPVASDLASADAVVDALGGAGPAGVLVCASTQSPWERLTAPSAWTALVERAGFGLTLPFHAELAGRAGAALPAGAWLVNACFPDAVNPLLAARGVPVLCGVGNVGLVAASLQAALGLPDQRRLRVLAHHVHLHRPASPDGEAMAWLDGEPVPRVGALLSAQRGCARDELNHVTGLTAALLVRALLAGEPLDTHAPGPLGLPGGYPVRIGGAGGVQLRLPPGTTRDDAVAMNQEWALADGVVVDGDGRVTFSAAARAELDRVAPELTDGFAAAELDAVARRLHEVRERLRASPDCVRRQPDRAPERAPDLVAQRATGQVSDRAPGRPAGPAADPAAGPADDPATTESDREQRTAT